MSQHLRKICQDYMAGQIGTVEFLSLVQLPEAQLHMVKQLIEMPEAVHAQVSYESLFAEERPKAKTKGKALKKDATTQINEYFQKVVRYLGWPEFQTSYVQFRDALTVNRECDDDEDVYNFVFTNRNYADRFFRWIGGTAVIMHSDDGLTTVTATYRLCEKQNIVPPPAVISR